MQRFSSGTPSGRITLAFGLLVVGGIAGLTRDRLAAAPSASSAHNTSSAHHNGAARAAEPAAPVVFKVDPDAVSNPMRVNAPAQAVECGVPGVVRFVSANWECSNFPRCSDAHWVSFDQFASIRSVTDEITWGRAAGESTVGTKPDDAGTYGIWAVGGGSVGKGLVASAKEYPGVNGKPCRTTGACRINTSFQFNSFDATNVVGGLRVMMDYKTKLPTGARFFVAIADFSKRDGDGNLTALKSYEAEIQRDTGGDWVRGATFLFPEAAGVAEVLITITYINDPATADGYGVFLDNIHLDALFTANAPPCPSPATPAPPATDTPERATATPTRRIVIPTKTRTPTVEPNRKIARLPYVLRDVVNRPAQATVVPTAPTPTNTVTLTPEPTETPEPTWTPAPSDTPQPTPTSTPTPEPVPDVIIDRVTYQKLPGGMAVQIVDLFNQGDGAQQMYRWNVTGTTKIPVKDCRFTTQGVTIEAGEHYYVLAGTEADKQALVEPYLGRSMICEDGYIFHQTADIVLLLNEGFDEVDRFCWYQNGPYECSK